MKWLEEVGPQELKIRTEGSTIDATAAHSCQKKKMVAKEASRVSKGFFLMLI